MRLGSRKLVSTFTNAVGGLLRDSERGVGVRVNGVVREKTADQKHWSLTPQYRAERGLSVIDENRRGC